MKQLARSIALMGLVLVAACAEIPVDKFNAYRSAYADAEASTKEVLSAYGVALRSTEAFANKRISSQAQPALAPSDGVATLPGVIDVAALTNPARTIEDGIDVRLRALEVVSRYNDTMLAIAEGRRQEQLKEHMSGLAGAVEKLPASVLGSTPIAGQVVGILGTLLEVAQQAHDVSEFKRGIREGRPIITAIIDFFINGTKEYSETQHSVSTLGFTAILDEFGAVQADIFAIAKSRSETTDTALLHARKAAVADVNQVYVDVYFMRSGEAPKANQLVVFDPKSADPAAVYNSLVQSQLMQHLASAQALKERAEKIVASTRALHEALTNFAQLWLSVEQALTAVEASLDNPRSTEAIAGDIKKYAALVKAHLKTFEVARQ